MAAFRSDGFDFIVVVLIFVNMYVFECMFDLCNVDED